MVTSDLLTKKSLRHVKVLDSDPKSCFSFCKVLCPLLLHISIGWKAENKFHLFVFRFFETMFLGVALAVLELADQVGRDPPPSA